jgi:hypothetical protein
MLSAFPELQTEIVEDEELPYMMMMHLAAWIAARPSDDVTPAFIDRIVDFSKWCEEQPRGVDGGDDLFTILVVGFYEEIFRSQVGQGLLPRLIEREDFDNNAEYFRRHVGAENYDEARKHFCEPAAQPSQKS